MSIRLAADTVNGVYFSQVDDQEVLVDLDFYEALSGNFEGTIYGKVTDQIAKLIQDQYGISRAI